MVSCDLDFLTHATSATPTVTLASYHDYTNDEDELGVQRVHPHTHALSGPAVNIGGWKVPLPGWPSWGAKKPEEKKAADEGGKEGGKEKKVVRVWYPSQTQMSLRESTLPSLSGVVDRSWTDAVLPCLSVQMLHGGDFRSTCLRRSWTRCPTPSTSTLQPLAHSPLVQPTDFLLLCP